MRAIIEITYQKPHFSQSCGCNIPGGFEANCLNPEDFGCTQIYSGLGKTKAEAYTDIRNQLRSLGATEIQTEKLVETLK